MFTQVLLQKVKTIFKKVGIMTWTEHMNVFSFGVERMKRKWIGHSQVSCNSCFSIVAMA